MMTYHKTDKACLRARRDGLLIVDHDKRSVTLDEGASANLRGRFQDLMRRGEGWSEHAFDRSFNGLLYNYVNL